MDFSRNTMFNIPGASGPRGLRLEFGIVCHSEPKANVYHVLPACGLEQSPSLVVCHSAFTGGLTHDCASSHPTYMPGAEVLFAWTGPGCVTSGALEHPIGVILGSTSAMSATMGGLPNPPQRDYSTLKTDHSWFGDQGISNCLLATPGSSPLLQDRCQLPGFIRPGDWMVGSPFGPSALVAWTAARLLGSRGAGFESFWLNDRTRVFGEHVSVETAASESGCRPLRPSGMPVLHFERAAANRLEGLGCFKGTAPLVADGELDFKTKVAAQGGKFRRERLEGPAFDGVVETISIPGPDSPLDLADPKPPLGMIREESRYDGVRRVMAAREIALVKSPVLPAVMLLAESGEGLEGAEAGGRAETWRENHKLTGDDAAEFGWTLPEQLRGDRDNTAERSGVLMDPGQLREFTPGETEAAWSLDEAEGATLAAIGVREAMDPPKYTPVEDKGGIVSGASIAGAPSFIRQQEDGSVVIGDGYGGEIRMCRGHITITCPGDIRLLPGRDLMALAPRNLALAAGLHAQLASETGDVRIKAERDLAVMAGSGGERGQLTLECRATAKAEAGKPLASGVVVKSRRDVAVLAGSTLVLGGLNPADKKEATGKSRTGVDILIDAGGKTLTAMGDSVHVKAAQNLSMASEQGSALALAGAKAGVYATTLEVGAVNINCKVPQDSAGLRHIGPKGMEDVEFKSVVGNLKVKIDGDVELTRDLKATGKMKAADMRAADGGFGNASDLSGLVDRSVSAPKVEVDATSLANVAEAAASFAASMDPASIPALTGACQWLTGYKPAAAGDLGTDNLKLYEARWQAAGAFTASWTWSPIRSLDGGADGYLFPGKGSLDRKGSLRGGILKGEAQDSTLAEYKCGEKGEL